MTRRLPTREFLWWSLRAHWALALALLALFTDAAGWALLLAAFAYGVLACGRTGRDLGIIDHGAIVWDEIVPFWMVLFLAPDGLPWQLAAFLLFRCFDILKPPPADWFDARIKNGFGVMMDDVVAAAYTLFVLAAIKALLA